MGKFVKEREEYAEELIECFSMVSLGEDGLETDQQVRALSEETSELKGFVGGGLSLEEETKENKLLDNLQTYFSEIEEKVPREVKALYDEVSLKVLQCKTFYEGMSRFLPDAPASIAKSDSNWTDLMGRFNDIRDLPGKLAEFNRKTGFKFMPDNGMQAALFIGRAVTKMCPVMDQRIMEDRAENYYAEMDSYSRKQGSFNRSLAGFLEQSEKNGYPVQEEDVRQETSRLNNKIDALSDNIKKYKQANEQSQILIDKLQIAELDEAEDAVHELEYLYALKDSDVAFNAAEKQKNIISGRKKRNEELDEEVKRDLKVMEDVLDTPERIMKEVKAFTKGLYVMLPVVNIADQSEINADEKKQLAAALAEREKIVPYGKKLPKGETKTPEEYFSAMDPKDLSALVKKVWEEDREATRSSEMAGFFAEMKQNLTDIKEAERKQAIYEKPIGQLETVVAQKYKALVEYRAANPNKKEKPEDTEIRFKNTLSNLTEGQIADALNKARQNLKTIQELPQAQNRQAKSDALKKLVEKNDALKLASTEAISNERILLKGFERNEGVRSQHQERYHELRFAELNPDRKSETAFMQMTERTASYKTKAEDFIARFDDNKRLLHKNSPEYKNILEKLKLFRDMPNETSLKNLKKAAADYLREKKAGYHLSNTTSMRSQRLNYAKEILDFATAEEKRNQRSADISTEIAARKNDLDGKLFQVGFDAHVQNIRPENSATIKAKIDAQIQSIEAPVNELKTEQKQIMETISKLPTRQKVTVNEVANPEKNLSAILQ